MVFTTKYTKAMRKRPAPLAKKFAEGGYVPDAYDENDDFQKWKAKNAPNDSGHDYEIRDAYKRGLDKDPTTGQWKDDYQTVEKSPTGGGGI